MVCDLALPLPVCRWRGEGCVRRRMGGRGSRCMVCRRVGARWRSRMVRLWRIVLARLFLWWPGRVRMACGDARRRRLRMRMLCLPGRRLLFRCLPGCHLLVRRRPALHLRIRSRVRFRRGPSAQSSQHQNESDASSAAYRRRPRCYASLTRIPAKVLHVKRQCLENPHRQRTHPLQPPSQTLQHPSADSRS